MALIINPTDPNMNAYVDQSFVNDYAESVGMGEVWCNNVSKQESSIILASQYIDMKYVNIVPGCLYDNNQSMLFPRTTYVDRRGRTIPAGTIPNGLKQATAQLAIEILMDDGIDYNPNQSNNVKATTVSVGQGAVQESVQYWTPQNQSRYVLFSNLMNSILPLNSISSVVGYRTR